MKWILIVPLVFSGCASVPEDYRLATEKRATEITAHFNQLAGTNYEVPEIRWTDVPCEAGNIIGEASAKFDVLWISSDCAKRFPQQTMNDILPHELAHIFVDRFYKEDEDHNGVWQEIALKLGMDCRDDMITNPTLIAEYCH